MKVVSAGVIIINDKGQILGCVPYGSSKKTQNYMDIPKGKMEIGETPKETALREVYEETGINLGSVELFDYGQHHYIKGKDLYVFKCNHNPNLDECKCTTYFDRFGAMVPEIIDYKWVDVSDINNKFFRSLYPIINRCIGIKN